MQRKDLVLIVEPKPKLQIIAQRRCHSADIQFVSCETLARAMDFMQHNTVIMILCDVNRLKTQSPQVLRFFQVKQPWCFRVLIDMFNAEHDTDAHALFDPHESLIRPLRFQTFEGTISKAFSHAEGYLKTKRSNSENSESYTDKPSENLYRARAGMLHTLVSSLYSVVQYHPIFGGAVCREVVNLSSLLCQQLDMSPQKMKLTIISAKLCFIGAMHVEQDILRKPIKVLTHAEKNYLKECWSIGIHTVFPDVFESSSLIKDIVSHQFERYDGSGFPGEYAGKRIALESQVIGLARDCVMRRHGLATGDAKEWSQVVTYIKAKGERIYKAGLVRALIKLLENNTLESHFPRVHLSNLIRPGVKLKRSLYNRQFQRIAVAQQPISVKGAEILSRFEHRQLLGFFEIERG
jgi:response regulator RpfG family c-di-GMP phosphodiesterase